MTTTALIRPARIRNSALTGHQRLAEAPSAREAAVVVAARPLTTARERRARRRPWFIVAFSAALLGVFAWAAPPEAQGRLPDPARATPTRPGQPLTTPKLPGTAAVTEIPALTATPTMEIKVGGMKANPYAAATTNRRAAKPKRAKSPAFGPAQKVDRIKDNPYR
jgi:hypothetical protein